MFQSPLRPFYSSVLRPFLSALLKYVWPSVTSTDIRLPLNQNENQCKDIVEKSAGNRDSGTEELAGKKSALPDESSTRKRQMYQTLKCKFYTRIKK